MYEKKMTTTSNHHKYLTYAQMLDKLLQRTRTFDLHENMTKPKVTEYANSHSLLQIAPAVYDQGQTGTCTANAICGALQFIENDKTFKPSRLFCYYEERVREGQTNTTLQDTGADPMDGLVSLKSQGICSEDLWPFVESKVDTAPTQTCYSQALSHKFTNIGYVAKPNIVGTQLLDNIRKSILSSVPVLIGITVYSSFESDSVAKSGLIPLPNLKKETLLGYHEILIIAYDDTRQSFMIRNSWGNNWGLDGNAWLPYSYVMNSSLCSQFICITK